MTFTTTSNKMDVEFLVSPSVYQHDFSVTPFPKESPRAIPFPDGQFGDNQYIQISENGKKVTFNLQQGSTNDDINGTYPDAIILFTRTLLEAKNRPPESDRYTSMAITDLENANLHLFARSANRNARGMKEIYLV